MMAKYAYHRPTTLDDALRMHASTPGARFIAGGTDLLVQMRKQRGELPGALISLRNVPSLTAIRDEENALHIGAGALLSTVAEHPAVVSRFADLVEAILVMGSRQIRNVATLGGNLCNASPAADAAPPLLVHEARVVIRNAHGQRELPLTELFRGPGQTALESGDILQSIVVPHPPAGARALFLRKGRVRMDLAMASLSLRVVMDGRTCSRATVAAGAVAPVPKRLTTTEAILSGSSLDDDTLERAAQAAQEEIAPISDLRSSAGYRRELVAVFVRRALRVLRTEEAS